jgi:hypothetical protein
MKCGLTTAVAVMLMLSVYAKDIKYPVSAIPEELKKNANVVIRDDQTIFRILSQNQATVHIHYAVTIMNSNGKDYAEMDVVYFDKLMKIKDLKATAYDANGDLIKKLKSSEIMDRAESDGFSLYSDNRVKSFDLSQSAYPYTVEVEYDKEYSFLFFIDGSAVANEEKVSVQNFVYELIYPTNLKPRYKTYNIDTKPAVVSPSPGVESMRWTINNVTPFVIEPMASSANYVKRIAAAPGNFEMEGYAGSMSNWQDLGRWQEKLNSGRDKLPEETKTKVRELVKGLNTHEEKAKAIYEYMQSRTRYVSVQLGIGGWQPFDATTVDKNGYGDCKALSNYMVAMLKEAGVPAFYTIIRAGSGPSIDPTFPANAFNHVIVGVPNKTDTVWLECTSQTTPFGYVGKFTGNRYGLMITGNGGQLRKTTYYPTEVNVQSTTAEIDLEPTGNAKAKIKTNYAGLQYENSNLDYVINLSNDDKKKWIQNNTDIPNFNINQFDFVNNKKKLPNATVSMDLALPKYASVSNKRIFLTPNLMNRWTYIPEKIENRKTPFVLQTGFTDIDTVRFHFPENIYPEFLPQDSKITTRFGTYEAGFKLEAGSLLYIRRMTRKDGEFPAEAYQELIDFYKSVSKADNIKLVFLSKT